jgi:branched-chain amino acid transport system substrate-binding protein
MKSRILSFLLVVVLVLSLTACQSVTATPASETKPQPTVAAPASTEPIKIAALMPMSGPASAMGDFSLNGIKLAIEEWNAKGGVLGRKVELVLQDSQCSAEPAVSAANKVITQDGVKLIIGEICSSASIPISDIAVAKGVLQISTGSTSLLVTASEDGKVKPTVFRTAFIDSFQGTVLSKFAAETLKAKTAAILFDQGNDYSRGLAEVFRDQFKKLGGNVVVWESYTADDQNFSAILTMVKKAAPDVLFMPDNYSVANLQLVQAREMGIKATLLGADGWGVGELDLASADGGYYTDSFAVEDPRPIVQTFVTKFKDKYGKLPDAGSMQGYDTVYIMLTAIEKAGTAEDVAKIAKVIESNSFETVGGTLVYDAQHNPKKSAVIFNIKDKKRVFVNSVAP